MDSDSDTNLPLPTILPDNSYASSSWFANFSNPAQLSSPDRSTASHKANKLNNPAYKSLPRSFTVSRLTKSALKPNNGTLTIKLDKNKSIFKPAEDAEKIGEAFSSKP